MDQFPDDRIPELEQILAHCKEGINGNFGIGAQFMSEMHGGSNIPANLVTAVPDGKKFKIYGNKFFCSAIHADYAVVTAKVNGTDHVGVFVIPSWLPEEKKKEQRNGYVINRLKSKMGTVELPTAEVDYQGAVAYPVGPLEKGVAHAVGIVLTRSRLAIGLASAALMLRAAREVRLYSDFREVFGRKIRQYPLAARQLEEIETTTRRTVAGVFKIQDAFNRLSYHPGTINSPDIKKRRLILRELILLQKVFTAEETVEVLRTAISLFGGYGVMEDFSSLPRLLRDAMINELWEGPKNVLLTQVYRDLQKAQEWYDPEIFVKDSLHGADPLQIQSLSSTLKDLLNRPLLDHPNAESMKTAEEWEVFCQTFFKIYQEQALKEAEEAETRMTAGGERV
ncbi:acyl-CoA dehydrogenase family protein [Polycladomyces subterraneus]|uniref:Acyl-CoA dehydrogenase family protein n=1 Tax=Polycladomyces subterraneus TaxID=1016997 RepID=A0ABT8IK17_9BACL|nr:acyl-CoA dehydrogenase family protein [Polycladomyces subterraneus]MDN4593065.1 acyl-CoA dehydrogenase family protein [Polycladomyces subterraneus]